MPRVSRAILAALLGLAATSLPVLADPVGDATPLRDAYPVEWVPADSDFGDVSLPFQVDWSLGLRGAYQRDESGTHYEMLVLPSITLTNEWRRARLTASMLLQLAGWMASGMWLWIMLKVMGYSTGFWSAIALQALLEGLRSALVFIPAAVGVQEAGYAALAPLFGLAPETGLAVSLLRRARDVTVAVPVLLAWQAVEARRAARGSR